VAIGVARHAIESFTEIAGSKVPSGPNRSLLRDRPQAQIHVGQAEGLVRAARAYLHQSSEEVWKTGESKGTFDLAARASARLAVVTATKLAAQAVDLIYEVAGMDAVQKSRPLERCWRDVHTVTQHITVNIARYETVGQVLLGGNPGGFV
jgi:alkylation response protein AidB-like acyl-CoA dehydrogenase